jgi:phosphoenolpyruvate carboxykinase (ATP)
VVKEPGSEADIWWGAGSPNYEMDERTFILNRERAVDYLNTLDRLYGGSACAPAALAPHSQSDVCAAADPARLLAVAHLVACRAASRPAVFDGYAGWDPEARFKIRVVCARPYHALFMHNMLIR